MISDDMDRKQVAGNDFNSFMLYQRAVKNEKTASAAAEQFVVKQVLLMHRVALMQQKIHYIHMARFRKDTKMHAKYEASLIQAEKRYEEAYKCANMILARLR